MRTIRTSVFETNSSSTHCLTFVTKAELDDFHNEFIVYDVIDQKMVPASEMYDAFMREVESHDCTIFRKHELPKEEFAKWVHQWQSMLMWLSTIEDLEPDDLNNIRYAMYNVKENGKYIAYSHCDDISKQVGNEDLYALSMYKEE